MRRLHAVCAHLRSVHLLRTSASTSFSTQQKMKPIMITSGTIVSLACVMVNQVCVTSYQYCEWLLHEVQPETIRAARRTKSCTEMWLHGGSIRIA